MAILSSELKLYQSENMVDGASGGGRMSNTEITTGQANGIFRDVLESEYTAGITLSRKVFWKNANIDDLTLNSPCAYIQTPTTSTDTYVEAYLGTATNVFSDLTGSERKYGTGTMNADIVATAVTADITVENETAGIAHYQVGDTILLRDDTNQERLTLTSVSNVGTVFTLGFAATANSYTAANGGAIASCVPCPDSVASVDNYVVTSGAGTFDDSGNPILPDNIGGVEDSWTVTFSDSTNFTVVGAVTGSVGAGTVGASFAPSNPAFTQPFFTIPAAGWGGTFAAADTLTFDTHISACPIWLDLVVAAGSSPIDPDGNTICIIGN